MRIVICWTHISGYMASCWREIASMEGVELFVVCMQGHTAGTPFGEGVFAGVNGVLVPDDKFKDTEYVRGLVADQKPDVVMIAGWAYPSYRKLPFYPELASTPFVMGSDTPYLGTWKQRLGRFAFPKFFSRIDMVAVPGERARWLAKNLGFPEHKIRKGMYGVDATNLGPLYDKRAAQPGGWPRKFVNIGRVIDIKGIEDLAAAYRIYRDSVSDPWGLVVCGDGPLKRLLEPIEGVDIRGFVQPDALRDVLVECGAMVLASRFDPWPLVVVESCASGLPVVCTEACGSSVELVRPLYNGVTVPTRNPEALARGMRFIHDRQESLPEMGARSRTLADGYSSVNWAKRWHHNFSELIESR